MSDNMVLLSQGEIDSLLDFLKQQKSKFGNEVMDQESVDRLISLLRTDSSRNVKFDTVVPEMKRGSGNALIRIEEIGSLKEQQQNCKLECEMDQGTGYIRIFCYDKVSDKKYYITPKCMEQMRYISGDNSEWGRAVVPLTFDQIAVLFSVKYSKATFDKITAIFTERMYGEAGANISDLYMPTAYNLIHHLSD